MTECSIIIPTYERPSYLKRILGYYDDSHALYDIIVADGSSDEIKLLNRETVSSFPGLKIQHLDKYSSEIPPHVRVADALEYVNTRYCVICADDDFITPNGIKQAVAFLEENPDFTAAHGRYIGFRTEEDGQGKQQFCWEPYNLCESITFSAPAMRLRYHLSDYSQSTFYAVCRADFLKMIYAENIKFTFNGLLIELFLSMLTLIYGKLKCLDVLYAARDSGSITTGGYRPTLNDAIENGTYDEEYDKFRDCLAAHLSNQSELDMEESGKVVDEAMSAYMKKNVHSPIGNQTIRIGHITTRMGYILDSLNLPDWAKIGLRRAYAKLTRTPFREKYSTDMARSSKYYEDFDKIRHHVLSFSGIRTGNLRHFK